MKSFNSSDQSPWGMLLLYFRVLIVTNTFSLQVTYTEKQAWRFIYCNGSFQQSCSTSSRLCSRSFVVDVLQGTHRITHRPISWYGGAPPPKPSDLAVNQAHLINFPKSPNLHLGTACSLWGVVHLHCPHHTLGRATITAAAHPLDHLENRPI